MLQTNATPNGLTDVSDICLEAIHKSFSDNRYAESLVNPVLERANKDEDLRAKAWGLCARGKIRFAQGALTDGIDDLHHALRLAQRIGETHLEGFCYQFLGACLFEQSEYAQAIEYSYEAVFVRRRLPNELDLAQSLGGLGALQGMLGNWRESANCLTEALEIARRSGSVILQGTLLSNMAILFSDLGNENREQARDCFAESAGLLRTADNSLILVNCLTGWAGLLVQLKEWQGAEALAREATEVAKTCAFTRAQLKARTTLATVLYEQGRFAEAEDCLREASRVAEVEEQADRYPLLPQTWGNLHWRQGELAMARSYFEKALADAERMGQKDVSATLDRQLSHIAEELGDFQAALRYFQSFYEKNHVIEKQAAQNLLVAQKAKADVERARQEAELERLRNFELAEANREKDQLLVQLRQQAERLARQAIEDPLTGLYNRRYLMEQLDNHIKQGHYNAIPLSVMIADLDNFKKINDTFSHAIGDEVLKAAANLLRQSCRPQDIIARYGGEEFVVVFPATTAEKAAIVCERIREVIAAYPWHEIHPDLRVTVSAGVADEVEDRAERLLAIADRRLYRAKHEGKNRVIDRRRET